MSFTTPPTFGLPCSFYPTTCSPSSYFSPVAAASLLLFLPLELSRKGRKKGTKSRKGTQTNKINIKKKRPKAQLSFFFFRLLMSCPSIGLGVFFFFFFFFFFQFPFLPTTLGMTRIYSLYSLRPRLFFIYLNSITSFPWEGFSHLR
ncbi:MAG: hypothetical protein J3R72DRAFT_14864 [Linnemannia gamsii]|nr:MAG: hypothetical protein J3R72DRAFT_14864 [Linnemannia gamsii]